MHRLSNYANVKKSSKTFKFTELSTLFNLGFFKMDEPKRYAKNGICRFENFPECLNNLNEVDMGTTIIDRILIKWFMGLERDPNPEGARFRAYIRSECEKKKNVYCGISKNIGDSEFANCISEKWSIANRIRFRTDRALKVMMQSILTPFSRESYCNKELLHFHSKYVSSKFSVDDPILSDCVLPLNRHFHEHYTDVALQIAHGVRLPLSVDCCFKVAEIAEKLKLRNVSRYVERKMMEIDGECNQDYCNYWKNDTFLKMAIRYDFNHFLAHYMKTRGSTKKKFSRSDIQQMSKNTKMLTGNNQCRIS
ncbi:unnamed protein product [Caenorhabditis nigoni]